MKYRERIKIVDGSKQLMRPVYYKEKERGMQAEKKTEKMREKETEKKKGPRTDILASMSSMA